MLFTCRSHSQFTAKCHAENSWRRSKIRYGVHRLSWSLKSIFASCCLDPSHKNWVLSEFQFQPIWLHPSLDSFDALGQSKSGSRLVGGKAMEIKLAVVGIWVGSDTKWGGNGDDIWGVQDEKEWAQHRTLWHAVFQFLGCYATAPKLPISLPTCHITPHPERPSSSRHKTQRKSCWCLSNLTYISNVGHTIGL